VSIILRLLWIIPSINFTELCRHLAVSGGSCSYKIEPQCCLFL